MSNVGFATLTIIPSARGFSRALGSETEPAMRRAGANGGAAFSGALLPGIGKLAAMAGTAFAAVGVGGFFKDAVSGASELEQSVGAIETVFKGSAGQMLSWSSSAATAVGLTANEYNTLGTLIGTQLKNGGTSMDELAGKTNDLIGVGADLSSMFGGTTSQAVEALSSALKGERDPIEAYGVSLTQAAIDAKAAEMGFSKVGGSLDAQANQAATLALIMDQTADAQGNFGRESDTLAHKQQVLNAMWENGKTKIGQALLPAISGLAGALIGVLGPSLDGAVKGINFVVDAAKLIGGIFTGTAADVDLGPMQGPLTAFGTFVVGLLQSVGAAFAPFIPQITGALAQLVPAFASVLPSLSPFGVILQALLPILPQVASFLGAFAADLAGVLGPALTLIAPLLSTLASTISQTLAAALPMVLPLITQLEGVLFELIPVVAQVIAAVLPLVTTLISQLAPVFAQLVGSVLPPVISIIGMVAAAIGPLVNVLLAFLVPAIQALMPVVTTVFGVIVSVITAALKIVQGIIQVVTGVITGNWSQVWAGIGNILSGAWNLIKAFVTGAIKIVGSVISAGLGLIRAAWSAAWAALRSIFGSMWASITSAVSNGVAAVGRFFSGMWGGISGAVSSGVSGVVSFFSSLPGRILGALSGLGGLLAGVGRNLIEGLIGGVQAVAGRIKDAVLGPIKNSVDAVKNFLGIHSPSRLFRSIGGFTGEGMALGLEDKAARIAAASDSLIPDAPTVDVPDVKGGGVMGASRSAADGQGGPFIGSLTLASSGDVKSDLDEVNFYLRTKTRGGRFA